jgi:hypothetical protein
MSVLVRHVVDVLAVVAVLADVQKHQTLEFSDSSIRCGPPVNGPALPQTDAGFPRDFCYELEAYAGLTGAHFCGFRRVLGLALAASRSHIESYGESNEKICAETIFGDVRSADRLSGH